VSGTLPASEWFKIGVMPLAGDRPWPHRERNAMRIAQIAPLAEAVPPKLYGGTERVVSWLSDELIRQGHEVTLFASGDSTTSAELVPCAPHGLRLAGIRDHVASHLVMLDHVRRRADQFDVLHFHVDLLQHAFFQDMAHKCVTTMHGRLDIPDYMPVYRAFPEMPLVSISDSQRAPMPSNANWLATIPHGLPATVCPFSEKGGDYLAFLGRIAPEKRPDRAIKIARRAGVPIKIAAKVDKVDQEYFEEIVVPLLDHPLVEFIGEIGESQKSRFLGDALALLFPIDWPEPFGLVMIEAMSAGTPVIAWRKGSVPEIIEDGVNGTIVETMDEAVAAVEQIRELSRARVRRHFEEHFTAKHMADDYVAAYQALLTPRTPIIEAEPQAIARPHRAGFGKVESGFQKETAARHS
jgi:glycosyltransferase involved in cell wall biosynthesis